MRVRGEEAVVLLLRRAQRARLRGALAPGRELRDPAIDLPAGLLRQQLQLAGECRAADTAVATL